MTYAAFRGLGEADLSDWITVREDGAPLYRTDVADEIWRYLDAHFSVDRGIQGTAEIIGFEATPSGTPYGTERSAGAWADRKIAFGWDVAVPLAVLVDASQISPDCETEVAAAAVTPMGIDDARELHAAVRKSCGAFLPPRRTQKSELVEPKPASPPPAPPVPEPVAKVGTFTQASAAALVGGIAVGFAFHRLVLE